MDPELTRLSEEAQHNRMRLAEWMIQHRFATGHGGTFDDLLNELSWQVKELKNELKWSYEENCYVATVPSMPGCIATGNTVQETMKNLEAAKLEWTDEAERLASARSEGRKDV